jgi:hypothetical protein
MEATVSILARIPKGEGYRLATLEKKRGSFIKPADALCYYLRYSDATTRKRLTVPAGEDFSAAVVKALTSGTTRAPSATAKRLLPKSPRRRNDSPSETPSGSGLPPSKGVWKSTTSKMTTGFPPPASQRTPRL